MAKEKGTGLTLGLNDSSVYTWTKTFDYTMSGNIVESTTLSDGEYNSYMPVGGKNIQANIEGYVVGSNDSSINASYLQNAFQTNASLGFKFTDAALKTVAGQCWVNDLKFSNPGAKDLVGFSCTIQSTGPYSVT